MLTRADGVGPKLGQRIVNELKDKTASILLSGLSSALPVAAAVAPISAAEGPLADAVSALVNLGYGRSEAFAAVGAAAGKDDGANVQALITAGLKELSS
jgi:Holliday junction DNA helicase RuvA